MLKAQLTVAGNPVDDDEAARHRTQSPCSYSFARVCCCSDAAVLRGVNDVTTVREGRSVKPIPDPAMKRSQTDEVCDCQSDTVCVTFFHSVSSPHIQYPSKRCCFCCCSLVRSSVGRRLASLQSQVSGVTSLMSSGVQGVAGVRCIGAPSRSRRGQTSERSDGAKELDTVWFVAMMMSMHLIHSASITQPL